PRWGLPPASNQVDLTVVSLGDPTGRDALLGVWQERLPTEENALVTGVRIGAAQGARADTAVSAADHLATSGGAARCAGARFAGAKGTRTRLAGAGGAWAGLARTGGA